MSDYIEREYLVDHIHACMENDRLMRTATKEEILKIVADVPSAQPKKVYIAEIKIDGDEMQKCVDKAVNRILYDAYQPLTEEDYTSLRERFGAEVEKTVREMAEGNANRWMI